MGLTTGAAVAGYLGDSALSSGFSLFDGEAGKGLTGVKGDGFAGATGDGFFGPKGDGFFGQTGDGLFGERYGFDFFKQNESGLADGAKSIFAKSWDGAKDLAGEAWDGAKADLEKSFVVRDPGGDINLAKSAGKTGYAAGKALVTRAARKAGFGGAGSAPEALHVPEAPEHPATGSTAEEELRRLMEMGR